MILGVLLLIVGFICQEKDLMFEYLSVVAIFAITLFFAIFIGGTPFVLASLLCNDKGMGFGIICN